MEIDKRHDVSMKALETLAYVMYAQDEYGYKKYGTELKHTQNYGWLQMFLEEMADGLKYIQNEIDRKQKIVRMLEAFLEVEDKGYIIAALELLKMDGTGKEEHNG